MWLKHFQHFAGACADMFIHALGSTWLGLAINALFAVGTIAITLLRVRKKHGSEAMMAHWKEEMQVAFRVGIVCAACLYVPVIIYAVGKAAYDDHQGLVAVSKGQKNAIERINSTPIRASIHLVSDLHKHVTMVLLTDKVQMPAVVVMTCDGPVVKPMARMAESRFMVMRPPSTIPNTNTWIFEIQSPAWSPTEPMFIDYDYVTSINPKCGFEAKDQRP